MKKSCIIFIVALLSITLFACGCKSSRLVEESNVSVIDTTKTTIDSLVKNTTETDTTKTEIETEQSAVIEFVDGGGTVNIDSAGNIILTGVQSIKGSLNQSISQQNGISRADESTEVHGHKENGINKKESQKKQQEKKAEAPKWYQSILAKIGGLCCIAALIYAIFLYLKRKS